MNEPLVSVCMPASRPSAMFDEALSSVLAQTLDDFEVIVTDDSGGSLRTTIEDVNDTRVRYHPNAQRLGLSGNHCKAIDHARGRFIAILHDDDAWLPTYLATSVDVFQRQPEVGLCISATLDVAADGTVLRRKPTAMVPGIQDDPLSHLLNGRYPVMYPSSAMWRRAALDSNRRPWPELIVADITAFIDPVLSGWQLYFVDTPLVRYRVHDGQIGAVQQFIHRDGQVRLWSHYRFAQAHHERQRRRLMASWSIARAGAHLLAGRSNEARRDLKLAAQEDRTVRTLRRVALRALCSAPWLVDSSRRALDTGRQLKAVAVSR